MLLVDLYTLDVILKNADFYSTINFSYIYLHLNTDDNTNEAKFKNNIYNFTILFTIKKRTLF